MNSNQWQTKNKRESNPAMGCLTMLIICAMMCAFAGFVFVFSAFAWAGFQELADLFRMEFF